MRVWLFSLCFWLAMFASASAKPVLNADDPVGFFTTVADEMLRSTFGFGVTNIPVETNGVFVYSPAVQRVLQLAANIYDATTNRTAAFGKDYPSVFRPLFSKDAAGNIFITGYTNVSSVGGAGDLQLSMPFDVATIAALPGVLVNVPENIYGVPWIIGAKKGFPNFNEFSMESVVQVTRKLQLSRTNTTPTYSSGGVPMKLTGTNQMYIFGITNYLGVECWNSYSNAYTNVQIIARDNLSLTLTNDAGYVGQSSYAISTITNVETWPGWSNSVPNPGVTSSFVLPLGTRGTNLNILPASVYGFGMPGFVDINSNPSFENYPPATLPQFGLLTTNRLQVFMLDTDTNGQVHVIDYVHFRGPESYRILNNELSDPDSSVIPAYLWSTNLFGTVPWGVINQINVSSGAAALVTPTDGGQWNTPPGLPPALRADGINAIVAYFAGFLAPNNIYSFGGKNYTNTEYVVQAPYTPTRTIVDYVSWQANDPLVHYLVSDLNYVGAEPYAALTTGITTTQWGLQAPPILPDLGEVNQRYQPWGKVHVYARSDNNPYNSAYKDPLVSFSDKWDFPSGNGLSLMTIGQIHRGTPWQTVYLKTSNILQAGNGIATWTNWTGDSDVADAVTMAPIQDRHLVSLLILLFNTNNPTLLFSVNNPDPNAWQGLLNGLTALTNSSNQYDPVVISSNSPQASVIANAIQSVRVTQSGQFFSDVGDILATSQLAEQSPFLAGLNATNAISDEAYEIIPTQLLLLLRPDSVGVIVPVNGGWNIQFSGFDGFAYALQTSTDLVNWKVVSTNYPVQGSFILPMPLSPISPAQFYRSKLLL